MIPKSYDYWKTTNPDDEWLGNAEQREVPRHFSAEREQDFADDDSFVDYVDKLEEREREQDRLDDIERGAEGS